MKSSLSALAFLFMIVVGFVLPLGLVYLIYPPAVLVVIGFYLICVAVLFFEISKQETSIMMWIVVAPMMIGCLALVFTMIFFAWIPGTLRTFYIATLKGTFRIREKQPRVNITTQKKLDALGSGYHFRFRGEIDKNVSRRKGKIIIRRSAMYLGTGVGWIATPNLPSLFPKQLSVDTGDDIITFKSPIIDYPDMNLVSLSRFGYKRNQRKHAVELNIPERPELDTDIPIGTRHEWELRVGDELLIEGQVALQYRVQRNHARYDRRIQYEKLEILNPREWVVYEPDEDDIAVATREREHHLYVQQTKEPIRTVGTIADFMTLEVGQRFVIHGKVTDDNETVWHDYVYYRPGPRWTQKRWFNGNTYDVLARTVLTIAFPDGTYPFNLTLRTDFGIAPGNPASKVSVPKSGGQKIKFPQLDNPAITEGLQNNSRAYHVLKVGDRVIVHARKLSDMASGAMGVEPPAFGVEQVIVDTNRGWILHSWADRSPIELSWWERKVQRDKERHQKRTRNTVAGRKLRKSLGLPPTTSRFGGTSQGSRFTKTSGTLRDRLTQDSDKQSNDDRTSDTLSRFSRFKRKQPNKNTEQSSSNDRTSDTLSRFTRHKRDSPFAKSSDNGDNDKPNRNSFTHDQDDETDE